MLALGLALAALVSSPGGATAATDLATAAKPPRTPTLLVAPTGSDAAPCTKAAPCATLGRAYRIARPGTVVGLAGGTYPHQEILGDGRRKSRHVVFRPLAHAHVVLGGLAFGNGDPARAPASITIERIATAYVTPTNQRGVSVRVGSRDITLREVDAGGISIHGARGIRVLGGDWGPCYATSPQVGCDRFVIDAMDEPYRTRDIVVDGALIHDYRLSQSGLDAGMHYECVYLNASENVTIRNSRFRDCAFFDIFVTLSGPSASQGHRRLTIENNWFDAPWNDNPAGSSRTRAGAVVLSHCQASPRPYDGVLVRFNSFHPATTFHADETRNTACALRKVRVVGNLLMWDGCDARVAYAYNVWSSAWRRGRCSSTDVAAGRSFPYVRGESGDGFDFRLGEARWGVADELVPLSAGCPARDLDGDRRPAGRRCDAGADERPGRAQPRRR